ncbi:MAG TPA: hypothetical protein VLF39_00055 [Candidatus Saccharimonadales bacterium]|nr:hypothetical protein [Candidatus Saccharimonadales bacterium]
MSIVLGSSDFDLLSNHSSGTSLKWLFKDPEKYRLALNETPYPDPEAVFQHETAHLETAKAVGILAASYCIEFFPSGYMRRAAMNLGYFRGVPRIALAAVAIAPANPSDSDLEVVEGLGYKGIDEIGEKIELWNDRQVLQIPKPLSLES